MSDLNRRPVGSRKVPVFQKLAFQLVRLGLTPNQVSVGSTIFAILAAVAIWQTAVTSTPQSYAWIVLALVGIQMRLVCNLIDGLMAVEGGKKTKVGDLYNDLPDRLSDVVLILSAGVAAQKLCPWSFDLSVAAAFLAVATAYIRVLGGSLGVRQFFIGPMAKQQRMFVLNLALLGTAVEITMGTFGHSFHIALWVILLGSFITCLRRLISISRELPDTDTH